LTELTIKNVKEVKIKVINSQETIFLPNGPIARKILTTELIRIFVIAAFKTYRSLLLFLLLSLISFIPPQMALSYQKSFAFAVPRKYHCNEDNILQL
jgi:hypothetical protein